MIHSSTSRNHISDVSADILATGSTSLGSPNGYNSKHASFQEKAAKLHSHIPQEKETDKYFQTEAHLSTSPLNCCPFARVTKPEQKCRDKKRKENIKEEEQKRLALGMDNTFCARAHTTGEEVQRELCAQNESASTPER